MRLAVFFLLAILSFSSCNLQNKSNSEVLIEAPKVLLEKKEMVRLLAHVSLIESAYAVKYVQLVRYSEPLSKDVEVYLKENGVSVAEFEENIRYYTTQSIVWVEMQEEITSLLREEQQKIQPPQ